MPGASERAYDEFKGRSLGVFPPENGFRKTLFVIVDDKRFEYSILLLILASSITMACESPSVLEDKDTENTLNMIDYVFTSIFTIEMLMKLIAFGLLFEDKGAYLRDPWNILDGSIVLLAIIGIALSDLDLDWVRSLRTMRVLRPLRVISRVPELKIVVDALFKSLPGLGNVLFVSLLFWLIFGILGMQLFMGKFYACSDPDVTRKDECFGEFTLPGEDTVREWDGSACNDAAVTTEARCVGVYQVYENATPNGKTPT